MENNYWLKVEWLIFKPEFNEELINYYDIINKYKKVIFSDYNDPLTAIKTNNKYEYVYDVKYINSNFNKEIVVSNNINLTHLTFGYHFNKEIDLSNNINLTHLTFGYDFNQEMYIPFNVKSLNMFRCNNQYIIDNLHNNIEELIIIDNDLNLDNLPNSIKNIYIKHYTKEINNLPNSIEYLELRNYNFKIRKIPKNLKTIKCDKYYKYINDFKYYEVIYH